MGETGPWFARSTCVASWEDGSAMVVKGQRFWERTGVVEARPELFTTSEAEAMAQPPQTRPCRQCGGIFTVPRGAGKEQVYCRRACRTARNTMLKRAGRIVGRPIERYPTNSLRAVSQWLERHIEQRAVVEQLRGHLTGYSVGMSAYAADDLSLRNEVERRDLLVRDVNKWLTEAEQMAVDAESLMNSLRPREEQIRLMNGYAEQAREREGLAQQIRDGWSRLFADSDDAAPQPTGRPAPAPTKANRQPQAAEPGPVGDFVYSTDVEVY